MPDDPHDAPEDETPGQRRARLMNLNNEGWHPEEVEPKVDEVPSPETSIVKDHPEPQLVEPKPEPEKPVSRAQSARDQK